MCSWPHNYRIGHSYSRKRYPGSSCIDSKLSFCSNSRWIDDDGDDDDGDGDDDDGDSDSDDDDDDEC